MDLHCHPLTSQYSALFSNCKAKFYAIQKQFQVIGLLKPYNRQKRFRQKRFRSVWGMSISNFPTLGRAQISLPMCQARTCGQVLATGPSSSSPKQRKSDGRVKIYNTVSARSPLTVRRTPRKKNYRECSNIKVSVSVH